MQKPLRAGWPQRAPRHTMNGPAHNEPRPLTVRPTLDGESLARARADAQLRAVEEASTACAGYATVGDIVTAAAFRVVAWRCMPRDGGVACGFDGQAVCDLRVKSVVTREICP
jgi:hypothetical protein